MPKPALSTAQATKLWLKTRAAESQPNRPEHALQRAVLDDAITLLCRPLRLPPPWSPQTDYRKLVRARAEAAEWLADDTALDYPFTFLAICAELHLSPAAIRAHVRAQQHLQAPETPAEPPETPP